MLSAENMPGKRITTNYNNYVLFLDVAMSYVGRSLNLNLSPSVASPKEEREAKEDNDTCTRMR